METNISQSFTRTHTHAHTLHKQLYTQQAIRTHTFKEHMPSYELMLNSGALQNAESKEPLRWQPQTYEMFSLQNLEQVMAQLHTPGLLPGTYLPMLCFAFPAYLT